MLTGARTPDVVRHVVAALEAVGGQRFVTQAGETAGLLLRQAVRLGQDGRAAAGLDPVQIQTDMRCMLIGVFNKRPDWCAAVPHCNCTAIVLGSCSLQPAFQCLLWSGDMLEWVLPCKSDMLQTVAP